MLNLILVLVAFLSIFMFSKPKTIYIDNLPPPPGYQNSLNIYILYTPLPPSTYMDCRGACIVPLYKGKGDKSECSNSRGNSLLSVVGEVIW